MSGEPRVRARYIRDFLAAVGKLPAPKRDAVLDRVPAATLEQIEHAGTLDWLDFEVNVVLTRAIYDALSPEEVHLFFRGLLASVYGTALFYPFVRSALRAYSQEDPGKSVRWIPGGAGLLFRDLGEWSAEEVDVERSRVHISGLPPIVDRQWLESVADSLHSLFDQIDREGSVVVEHHDADEGAARLLIDWSHPAGE